MFKVVIGLHVVPEQRSSSAGQQTCVFFLPIEMRRLADPALATNLSYWHPVIPLLENKLFWASENFDAFHSFSSQESSARTLIMNGPVLREQSNKETDG